MIASVLILTAAFYWLLRETNWLRVRLEVGETLAEYDRRILAIMEAEYQEQERGYQEYLKKLYAPKYVYGAMDRVNSYPQYEWLAVEENLTKRRNGEMPYQLKS